MSVAPEQPRTGMPDPAAATGPTSPTAAKVDPETMVLRAKPPRAVRFRRDVIIGGAACAVVALGGVAYVALKARIVHDGGGSDQSVAASGTPDALANGPKTYGDVPQLGPPLPGDLGRPILDRERELGSVQPDPAIAQAAEAAETQRKAAQESGVMIQMGGASAAATSLVAASAAPATSASAAPASNEKASHVALDPEEDPGDQQRKTDFVGAKDESSDVNSHALTPAASPYMLSAGTILSASLITGLNSDLPGLVTAQITENAYDTATGHYLLIPQGSRLIGSYDSVIAYGQSRALVVWQRIVLPDGSAVRIDNVPATDTAGYAGLADKVDVHTWQLLKGVALSTLLGVGTQLSFGSDESDLLRAIRESTQDSVSRAGDQIVSHALNIQPTITVRPGWPLRVVVHKDIVMNKPWSGEDGGHG